MRGAALYRDVLYHDPFLPYSPPWSEAKEFLHVPVAAQQDNAVVRGNSEVNVARRRLPDSILRRALAVTVLYLVTLLAGTLLISLIENGRFPLEDILFETSSAMGTVGVSAIGTPNLTPASRAVLLPMMFLGRVGPLTLAVAVAKRQGGIRSVSKYPEEKIIIG